MWGYSGAPAMVYTVTPYSDTTTAVTLDIKDFSSQAACDEYYADCIANATAKGYKYVKVTVKTLTGP
jgi:hypothetical protein